MRSYHRTLRCIADYFLFVRDNLWASCFRVRGTGRQSTEFPEGAPEGNPGHKVHYAE